MRKYGGYGSLDEYFQKEEKIYVRNMTKPLGLISVNFGDMRNPVYFTVLKTTVPICLTDFFDKALLVKSVELRTLIMKGVLELVSEADYRKLVSPEVEEKVKVAILNYGTGQYVGEQEQEGVPGVQSAVMQLMAYHLLSDEERKEALDRIPSDDQIITELSHLDLSAEDKSYILSVAKGKVKQWIMQQIGVSTNIEIESIIEKQKLDMGGEGSDSNEVYGPETEEEVVADDVLGRLNAETVTRRTAKGAKKQKSK